MQAKNEALLKALEEAVDGKTSAAAPSEPAPAAEPEAKPQEPHPEESVKAESTISANAENKQPEEKASAENEPAPEEKPAETPAEAPAEESPAPETAPAEAPAPAEKPQESAAAAILKICAPLTVICIVVSLMLALINVMTRARIEDNNAREKAEAISVLFPDATDIKLFEERDKAEIYTVSDGTNLLGACVTVDTNGFGGTMELMVGVNPDSSVRGVRILSMSETPGIGSKTNSDDFLSRYRDRTGPFILGQNFEGISGASVSSRAVTSGVNKALDIGLDFAAMAADKGLTVGALPVRENDAPAAQADALSLPEPAETTGPAATSAPAPANTQPAETTPAEIYVAYERTIPALAPVSVAPSSSRVTRTAGETVYEKETEPETAPPPADPDLPPEDAPGAETTELPAEGGEQT